MEPEELIERIKLTLETELPGAKADISFNSDTNKIGGRVIWDGFQGYNARRRQARIFRILRRHITMTQANDISYIFSYTPDQYASI